MHFRTALAATVVAVACLPAASRPALAQDVNFTRQPRFRIPYHSDPTELQRLGAREVQLYVSTDRGLTWRLAQTVPPTAGKFAYDAPADGEYWFAVRTVDSGGRLHPPAGQTAPGLKVVVDSQAPDLSLSLDRTGPRVRLSWRASDVNLDPASLRLEFKQPGMDDWQPVHVVAQAAGQTAWTAPATGTVAVRGQVLDKAGNAGTGSAELQVGNAGYAPLPANPELEGPIADASPPTEPIVSRGVPSQLVSQSKETPEIVSRPAAAPEKPIADLPGQKIVNTRAFNLNYQVEEVGPSGVGKVEFFITEDGGAKWFRYGDDPDKVSPIRIDLPGEGTYGFALRVRSGVGLAADPPKPGDAPSMTVVVDQTPPVVSLETPSQSVGTQGGVVKIQWTAQDAHPANSAAVDLDYASAATGPWSPIATGIENAGTHDWAVSKLPAGRVFVRVTARDAAGNVGQAITSEPVTVDLTRPTARITDIAIDPIR